MKYVLVSAVIVLVTYGQLIIKYEMQKFGPIHGEWQDAIVLMIRALMNPGIISGLAAAVLAAVVWIFTLSRYELSSVYPLLSLNFLLVPLLALFLFDESMNWFKGAGALVIVLGVLVFARGT